MPAYDYQCPRCHRTVEMVRSVVDRDDLVMCPNHKRNTEMRRLIALPQVPTMVDAKNMSAGDIAEALDHKRDIESRPHEVEWKEKGPREFRPEMPRTIY